MLNCKSFLVTEAERKHVRRRASLDAVACFLPGRPRDLLALPVYAAKFMIRAHIKCGYDFEVRHPRCVSNKPNCKVYSYGPQCAIGNCIFYP